MYRIFYKRAFSTQKEAEKAMKEVADKASNPRIAQGKSGAYLVVLYEHSSYERIVKGKQHYTANGLTTFIQEV